MHKFLPKNVRHFCAGKALDSLFFLAENGSMFTYNLFKNIVCLISKEVLITYAKDQIVPFRLLLKSLYSEKQAEEQAYLHLTIFGRAYLVSEKLKHIFATN